MAKCILSFDSMEILNKKTGPGDSHCDNDWLSMIWTINDQVYSKSIPLVNLGGSQVLYNGDVLRPFQDYVECKNKDTVIVFYSVINLSSYDFGEQAQAAAEFTKKVADVIGPIYVEAAAIVLGIVASGGTIAGSLIPQIIQQISGASAPLLDKFSGAVGDVIDKVFDEGITPIVKWVVEEFAEIITGRPNCNGEVFHDYVIFLPDQPTGELHLSKTYEGPQENSSCGCAPHTKVNVTMRRQVDLEMQDNWRQCQKCNGLFFNDYHTKGVCPGVQLGPFGGWHHGGHEAGGPNFIVVHDSNGTGQHDWRYCNKCQVMFYDGYANKGSCPSGGGHEAMGYNFNLMHDIPPVFIHGKRIDISGQPEWRYCWRCHALFYNGTPNKGVCSAGGAHAAAGFNFELNYQ